MENSPLVHIIITTYDPGDGKRFELLFATVDALKRNLRYPNLAWIIADDGSTNFPQDKLYNMLEGYSRTFINAERGGVGRSKNLSLQHAFTYSPWVFISEDDWFLKQPLDIYPHVKTLQDNPTVGMIRYGYLGGGLTAQLTSLSGVTYWKLLHKTGFYCYSGQVSLRSKNWYDSVGYHTEKVQAGKEEEELCHRYNNMESAPDILWDGQYGVTLNAGPFLNIGFDYSVNAVEPCVSG